MSSLFDYISSRPWTVKENSQLNLFEVVDGDGERIAMFKKKTDAYIASGAPGLLGRLIYLKQFQRSVLGQIDECLRLCFAEMHIEYTGSGNDPESEFAYDEKVLGQESDTQQDQKQD